MSWVWWTGLSVLSVLGLGAVGVLWKSLGTMVSDELKARLDDVPAMLVELALWRLPAHLRDCYKNEWAGDLLAAYNAKNARYPITKLLCAVTFAFPLIVRARALRQDFEEAHRQGIEGERNERLVEDREDNAQSRFEGGVRAYARKVATIGDVHVLRGDDTIAAVAFKSSKPPSRSRSYWRKEGQSAHRRWVADGDDVGAMQILSLWRS